MTADARERSGTGLTGTFGTAAVRTSPPRDFGPFDADELGAPDPEATDPVGLADFGSIRVPVPPDGAVTVEPTANGRLQAVHVALPGGRLSVSALAAPKSSLLWPELVAEIDSSLREGGARVRSYRGDWGRELHARTGAADSRFIGVDGARWMLYGVATGPTAHAVELESALRTMLRGTIVDRGRSPYPVRTVLPLVVPEHLADAVGAGTGAGAVPGPSPAPEPAGSVRPAPAAPVAEAEPGAAATTAIPVQSRPAPAPAPAPSRSEPARPARPVRSPAPPRRLPDPRSVPAESTQALPIAPRPVRPAAATPPDAPRGRARPDASVPLWAAAPTGVTDADFGPEPAAAVHTEPWALPPEEPAPVPEPAPYVESTPTEWWPAQAPAPASSPDMPPADTSGPADEPGPAGRGAEAWVADTPLHDELLPTQRWTAVPHGDVAPVTERWPAVPHSDMAPVTERWPAVPTEAPVPPQRPAPGHRGSTRWEPAPPTERRVAPEEPRHRAPAGPPAGGRRRAPEPSPAEGHRHADGHLDLDALVRGRPGRRRSRHEPEPDRPALDGPALDRPELDGPEPDRPEPDRPEPRDTASAASRGAGHRPDPPTEPLPVVHAEPDWVHPVDGPRGDGSAPALAFLAGRPARSGGGRHHRPEP